MRENDQLAGQTREPPADRHPMGYGHRAVALTQLPNPDWKQALSDMNRHLEFFGGHDPEAYRFRAWIHENLGNPAEANRDRRMAE